ncbi:hypothetical protein PET01_01820 [Pediococcus ethanolidurans]|nr:hypothetical protein PET01_01820 [Pediococcus ethanolidurans]
MSAMMYMSLIYIIVWLIGIGLLVYFFHLLRKIVKLLEKISKQTK